MRQRPVAFIGRTLTKLYYFWWFAPYAGRRYEGWQVAIYRGFYALLLALAALGLAEAWRRPIPRQRDGITLALLLLGTVSVAQSLFYIDGRHRLAVEALLVVFSGYGFVGLAAWLVPGRVEARPSATERESSHVV